MTYYPVDNLEQAKDKSGHSVSATACVHWATHASGIPPGPGKMLSCTATAAAAACFTLLQLTCCLIACVSCTVQCGGLTLPWNAAESGGIA